MSNKPQDMDDKRKRVAWISEHYQRTVYLFDSKTVQHILWLCDELLTAWDQLEDVQ